MIDKLKIILDRRKNKKGRRKESILAFVDKWDNAGKLLKKINEKISSKELKQEARKQYIISIVTALEVYFKDSFVELIDKYKFDYKKLAKDKKIIITLEDLEFIIKNKLTFGEITSEYCNFQNLNEVQKAFSCLFRFTFFEELKKYKWHFDKKDPKGFLQINSNFYTEIDKLIKLRHDFVHDINFKKFLSMYEIKKMEDELIMFVHMVNFFIDDLLCGKINPYEQSGQRKN